MKLWQNGCDNMDIDTSAVLQGKKTLDESGKEIHEFIMKVANGEQKAEVLGHRRI